MDTLRTSRMDKKTIECPVIEDVVMSTVARLLFANEKDEYLSRNAKHRALRQTMELEIDPSLCA